MKYIVFAVCFVLYAVSAQAQMYCQWTGTESTDCRAERNGLIILPNGLRVSGGADNFASHGYYLLNRTVPVFDQKTQKLGGKQETFDGIVISQTHSVISKTTQEINEETALTMSEEMYILIRTLRDRNKINAADINSFPQRFLDAFNAHEAIGK